MYMTDSELKMRYKNGASMTILAQLNGVPCYTIQEALQRAGVRVPTPPKRKKWDKEKAVDLYRRGLTDSEIARTIGVSHSTVYSWRNRKGLPANRREIPCATCSTPTK